MLGEDMETNESSKVEDSRRELLKLFNVVTRDNNAGSLYYQFSFLNDESFGFKVHRYRTVNHR